MQAHGVLPNKVHHFISSSGSSGQGPATVPNQQHQHQQGNQQQSTILEKAAANCNNWQGMAGFCKALCSPPRQHPCAARAVQCCCLQAPKVLPKQHAFEVCSEPAMEQALHGFRPATCLMKPDRSILTQIPASQG
jgi:hypothetical protein